MTQSAASTSVRAGALSPDRAELLQLLLERKSRQAEGIVASTVTHRETTLFPCSWAQRQLWFIDQLEGAGRAYHIPLVLELRGTLDLSALQKALDSLVARHESLRTVFVNVEGEPKQKVLPQERFSLNIVELHACDAHARRAQVELHQRETTYARFDLGVGPLIRGRLLRLSPVEHVLVLAMHHIVSDGWSVGVLLRELAALYTAYHEDRPDPLPPLPIQYVDYAQWQRQGKTLSETQLADSCKPLEGAPPLLELPTDRPRPVVQSYAGDNVDVLIEKPLTAALRALARHHEATVFMVLYAAWAVLLSRLSGQEDVLIGTPVANRQRPEVEGLIGFFANTVVIRSGIRGDLTLGELLRQVKAHTLEAYASQEVPFEKVVEMLQPKRSLDRNPIFQVMLVLQNAPKDPLQLPGLSATLAPGISGPAFFDLLLFLEERDDQIVGCLNYATDLFDRQTIERWSHSLVALLESTTRDLSTPVREVPILSGTERRQVLELFNATQLSYARDTLIHECFEKQVERHPESIAVLCGKGALTYAALNQRANRLARYLRSQGLAPDQPIGICVERTFDMVVGLLAILKAGGAYLPLDPNYPRERLQYMLTDAAPRLVLTHTRLKSQIPVTAAQMILLDEMNDLECYGGENLPAIEVGLTGQSLLYVIYTSGSTGQPKGTAMSHQAMGNLIEWHRRTFGAAEDQRVLQFAALSFDVAFQETFSTLCTGGILLLIEESMRKDPRRLLEHLEEQSVTRLFLPPMMLQSLAEYAMNSSAVIPHGLRDIVTAGEQLRISPEIVHFFKNIPGCRLHNHYGPTETHVVTALTLTGEPEQWPVLPTIGAPISNTQIYILDAQRKPVPIGVTGELYIGGAGLARGYLGQPRMTAQRFIQDPFSSLPTARLYRTGDLARWNADGTLTYLGRNDDQVKIRGFRIELGEIETQLAHHEHVKEVAVVAREDAPGERRLVAYLTPRHGERPTAERLRTYLTSVLPDHMIPGAYVVLPEMPLTPSGKLNRRALPRPDMDAYVSRQYEPPQGPIEAVLAEIWKGLLRVDRVGRSDNFFELGGHSLHGMLLIARVAQQLGVELSATALFTHPTVQQMAEIVEPKAPASDTGLHSHAHGDLVPLTFSQLAHWNLYELRHRLAIRQLAAAVRLRGRLSLSALRASLTEMTRCHEALRTRIVVSDGTPMQQIDTPASCDFEVEDLSALPERTREQRVQRTIEEHILEPIDVSRGPLFEVRLLRLRDSEHVLIVAMEHMISDGMSISILFAELFKTYSALVRGQPSPLPNASLQFADYAVCQRHSLTRWQHRSENHWKERLATQPRTRFPVDEGLPIATLGGWATVPVEIGKTLKAELTEWSRVRRTTLAMTVFTAYVALVLRWCNVSSGVIQYETNGRVSWKLERTIGYLASPMYLRMDYTECDTFIDLLDRVTQEYCRAYEHADSSYMEAQLPRPDFARNTAFNWVPQAARIDLSALADSDDRLDCAPVPFEHPMLKGLERDNEPVLLLYETDEAILGDVSYPRNRYSMRSMSRFAANFMMLVERLLREPETRIQDIALI